MCLRSGALSVIALATALWATAVNPVVAQQQDPGSWQGYVDVGLDASGGNTQLTLFRGGLSLTYLRTDRAEFEVTSSLRYGESQQTVIERQLRASMKLDLVPHNRWSPFVYTNLFRDPIRRKLDLRMETGGGGKYTFAEWGQGKASLSLAGVWTIEQFTTPEGEPSARDRNEARASWRSKFNHDLDEGRASFQQITFYQPVWDAWGDYVFVAQTSVRSRIVGSLSIVASHEYIHDQTPFEGVARDDWSLALSFRYDW